MQPQGPAATEDSPAKRSTSADLADHDGDHPTKKNAHNSPGLDTAEGKMGNEKKTTMSLRTRAKRRDTTRLSEFLSQNLSSKMARSYISREGSSSLMTPELTPIPLIPAPQLPRVKDNDDATSKGTLLFTQPEHYKAANGYPPALWQSKNLARLIDEKNALRVKIKEYEAKGWSAKLQFGSETPSSGLSLPSRYYEGEPEAHWEELEKLAGVNYVLRIELQALIILRRDSARFGMAKYENTDMLILNYVSVPSTE